MANKSVLTPDDRSLIIRWFIKTVIMYEFLGAKPHPNYFEAKERHALPDSISLPMPCMFFLARYIGSLDITTREMRSPFLIKRRDADRTVPVDGYSATFAIKQLALQIFSFRWSEGTEVDWDEVRVTLPGKWDDAAIDIRPSERDVIWPPPFHLTDESLDVFTRRWLAVMKP